MSCTAVIVAAGKGLRMGGAIPKQYLEINGKPVLSHTLDAFEKSRVDNCIVVCPKGDMEYVRDEIVFKFGHEKVIEIVEGGEERFDSCCAGIMAAADATAETAGRNSGKDKILIHDGVRALVTPELINRVIDGLDEADAVCPGVAVHDTMRYIMLDGSAGTTIDRNSVRSIQTPQGFQTGLLLQAYARFYSESEETIRSLNITDDCMLVMHYMDSYVKMVDGEHSNLKITTPEDIVIAEAILKHRA